MHGQQNIKIIYTVYFIKRSGKFAKSDHKLLALFFCLSVRQCASNNSAPTKRIFMKFHIL